MAGEKIKICASKLCCQAKGIHQKIIYIRQCGHERIGQWQHVFCGTKAILMNCNSIFQKQISSIKTCNLSQYAVDNSLISNGSPKSMEGIL